MSVIPEAKAHLDVARIGSSSFRSTPHPGPATRSYGGDVAGQAVMAASLTAPAGRPIHSAHMYFLAPGNSSIPIDHEVTILRDGGSFSARQVIARQGDSPIFTMTASFQTPETGLEHSLRGPQAPGPDELPTPQELLAGKPEALQWLSWMRRTADLDVRFVLPPVRAAGLQGETTEPHQRLWLRHRSLVEPDAMLQAAGLAYASDVLLLSTALGPHAVQGRFQIATVNHTIWFHRPIRVDEWFLYDQESTWADRGRALVHGRIFDPEGHLCASIAQEGLIRVKPLG